MRNLINCPYCGATGGIQLNEKMFKNGDTIRRYCKECEKTYIVITSMVMRLKSYTTDCLNGGDHKYEPVNLIPPYNNAGEYYCRLCFERQTLTKREAENSGLKWESKWDIQQRKNLQKLDSILRKIISVKEKEDVDLIKDLQGHLLIKYGINMTFEDE